MAATTDNPTFLATLSTQPNSHSAIPNQVWRLLAYLNEQKDASATREELCALLWDSNDQARVRHSLSQLLYIVGKKLPSVTIATSATTISLNSHINSDLDDLLDTLKQNDIKNVSTIYRKPYLSNLTLGASHGFEEWATRRAAQIEIEVVRCLKRGVRDAFARAEWRDCTEIAADLARIAPPDSDTRSLLELATTALEQVLVDSVSKEAFPSRFIGRAAELSRMRQAWNVASDNPAIVVINGEPGIGKSRLTLHFGRASALGGDIVLASKCYEAEQHVAFAMVVQLLDSIGTETFRNLPGRARSALAALHPKFSHEAELPQSDPPPSKTFLFESISMAIREKTRTKKLLALIDDAQWCDDASSEWLHHFTRSSHDFPSLVILTNRNDISHNARHIHWALVHQNAETIELDNLMPAEAVALVSERLSSDSIDLTADQVATVQRASGGNPLYIIALTDSIRNGDAQRFFESGQLKQVPRAIERLVSYRFARLSNNAKLVAEMMACMSAELSMSRLEKVCGLGAAQTADAVLELDSCRLIKKQELRLSHGLIESAVYGSMTSITQRVRHEHIYRNLDSESPAIRANHAYKGGLRSEAYKESMLATDRASKLYAYAEALHHYGVAIQCADDENERAHTTLKAVQLLLDLKRYVEAADLAHGVVEWFKSAKHIEGEILCEVAAINAALATGERSGSELYNRIQAVINKAVASRSTNLIQVLTLATVIAHFIGDPINMDELLNQAQELSAQLDPAARAQILAAISIAVVRSDKERAIRTSDEAIQIARGLGEPRLNIVVLSARAALHTLYGDVDAAFTYFAKAESELKDPALSEVMVFVHANKACILFDQGRFADARFENEKALRCTSRTPLYTLLNEAVAYLDDDDPENAILYSDRSVNANSRFGAPWVEMASTTIRGLAFLRKGEIECAKAEHDRVLRLLPSAEAMTTDLSYTYIFMSAMDRIRGDVVAARERLESYLARENINAFARCRIELALCDHLAPEFPDRAYRLAKSALVRSTSLNSPLLSRKAQVRLDALR